MRFIKKIINWIDQKIMARKIASISITPSGQCFLNYLEAELSGNPMDKYECYERVIKEHMHTHDLTRYEAIVINTLILSKGQSPYLPETDEEFWDKVNQEREQNA